MTDLQTALQLCASFSIDKAGSDQEQGLELMFWCCLRKPGICSWDTSHWSRWDRRFSPDSLISVRELRVSVFGCGAVVVVVELERLRVSFH